MIGVGLTTDNGVDAGIRDIELQPVKKTAIAKGRSEANEQINLRIIPSFRNPSVIGQNLNLFRVLRVLRKPELRRDLLHLHLIHRQHNLGRHIP
jgi:hypothetical protein